MYLRTSHRPFEAGYKAQIYSQKGTSLSNEAVAPSQYDITCWWDVLTQTQGSSYTRLYLNIFVVFHSNCILFQFFVCSFLKRKVVVHVGYLLRPTIVHIGIEGGSTAMSSDNVHTSMNFVSHMK